MKLCYLPLIALLIISCKALEDESDQKTPLVSIGGKMEKSAYYSVEEEVIIGHICNSFKYKRQNFPYNFWESTFEYLVQEKECDSNKTKTRKVYNQFSLNLTFMSQSTYPFEVVQSDESGFLEFICERSLQSQEAKEPLEISNTTPIGYKVIQQLKFKNEDSEYKFFVIQGQASSAGDYYVTLVDEIAVQIDQSNLNGLVTKHNRIELCTDGKDIKYSLSDFLKNSI